MAVYQFTASVTNNPLAFARSVAAAADHLESWGAPKPSAASLTAQDRLRITLDFVISQEQMTHLGMTLISA